MEKLVYYLGAIAYIFLILLALFGAYNMFNLTTETNYIVFKEIYGDENAYRFAIGLTIAGVIGLAITKRLFRIFGIMVIFVSINLALIATAVKDSESKNNSYKTDAKYLSLLDEKKTYLKRSENKDNNYGQALSTNMFIGARSYRITSERYDRKADSVQVLISQYENQNMAAGKNTMAVQKTFDNLMSLFGVHVSAAGASNYFNLINAAIGDTGFFVCAAGFFHLVNMPGIIAGFLILISGLINQQNRRFIRTQNNDEKPKEEKAGPKQSNEPKQKKTHSQGTIRINGKEINSGGAKEKIKQAYQQLKASGKSFRDKDVQELASQGRPKVINKGLVSKILKELRG